MISEQIQSLINKHDPIHLEPGVISPDDEYLSEAKIINEMQIENYNLDTFRNAISKLFKERFDASVVHMENINQLSSDLYSLLRK